MIADSSSGSCSSCNCLLSPASVISQRLPHPQRTGVRRVVTYIRQPKRILATMRRLSSMQFPCMCRSLICIDKQVTIIWHYSCTRLSLTLSLSSAVDYVSKVRLWLSDGGRRSCSEIPNLFFTTKKNPNRTNLV
jgi:hypothetical protein